MIAPMDATAPFLRPVPGPDGDAGFLHWVGWHRETASMAFLLGFAGPVTFFTGSLSVMRGPSPADIVELGLWWTLYSVQLAALLLAMGYADERLRFPASRAVRGAVLFLCASVASAWVTVSTGGRAAILVNQGVVQSAVTMHIHASVISLTMGLLFMAHLRRARTHSLAAARLVAAQAAQRDSRRRSVQARLAAVQARIDPQLLFGMLDAVRRSCEADPQRAERLLDELIAFLRAALPRLRDSSSSVPREAQLACGYARLHALADDSSAGMELDLDRASAHARFPPGVLLPMIDDALRARAGRCTLTARREDDACRLLLRLPAQPSEAALARVRSLLAEVYGAAATLQVGSEGAVSLVRVEVPYELA